MSLLTTNQSKSALYQMLPSVEELLHHFAIAQLVHIHGQVMGVDAGRAALAGVRQEIVSGRLDSSESVALAIGALPETVLQELNRATAFSLQPVINATGVILHTNLGRAPLAPSALKHIADVAGRYSNVEFDIASGDRGRRDIHVERLFSRLLQQHGTSDVRTVVVNNCAAAVMLALNTLAEGGEVIVSRGELVEIGGSFRVPDVMVKSGAVLREVGTTNRTRVADYERAISEKTRLLLRVHRSNFAIVGFTEQPTLDELVALGRKHNVPVMEDLGGGALLQLRSFGINESNLIDSLHAEVDIVTYSGDKMLGGPQAGLLSGREVMIKRVRSNPLFRALRVDKLTYAALEATLMEYVCQNFDAVPFARMMRISAENIRSRADGLRSQLQEVLSLHVQVIPGKSLIGGGSAPTSVLPTFLLAVASERFSAGELARRLRKCNPPVVGRVEENRLLLDLRTVFESEEQSIVQACKHVSSPI